MAIRAFATLGIVLDSHGNWTTRIVDGKSLDRLSNGFHIGGDERHFQERRPRRHRRNRAGQGDVDIWHALLRVSGRRSQGNRERRSTGFGGPSSRIKNRAEKKER